jgi:hypothetical protein
VTIDRIGVHQLRWNPTTGEARCACRQWEIQPLNRRPTGQEREDAKDGFLKHVQQVRDQVMRTKEERAGNDE